MPAIDEDDRPKKKITHEIGQDLALLSVGELNERIALLKDEIARLEAAVSSKQASRDALVVDPRVDRRADRGDLREPRRAGRARGVKRPAATD